MPNLRGLLRGLSRIDSMPDLRDLTSISDPLAGLEVC